MATSRRSLIAVFVSVLTLGTAAFFVAGTHEQAPSRAAEPAALSERTITATPPLGPEVRTGDRLSENDSGRRLPTTFGFIGLVGLALALAAAYAHQQRGQRGPVLALAFAHQGPRAPPRPIAFIR